MTLTQMQYVITLAKCLSFTEASRLLYKSVNLAKHQEAFAGLASGTHNYSITVKLATGETKTWEGKFTN